MAKRNTGTQRAEQSAAMTTAMERRLVAFAEELGRFTGTVQVKAAGWMDRKTLQTQIARVRDNAADLLEQLAGGVVSKKPTGAAARAGKQARSGGGVDAPGKKRRKALPRDPDAAIADTQAAKMRASKPMAKTNKLRGRG